MGAPVRFGIPYQITIRASDLGSGKAISNALYYRAFGSTGPPPAYGDVVAGPSDLSLVTANFKLAWDGIRALLNHNYSTVDYTTRSIIGKRYSSPAMPIFSLVSSLSTIVVTGLPHGLVTGDIINVFGVTGPPAANGVWVITVMSPTTFSLNGSGTFLVWSGDGSWQKANGKQEFLYGDKDVLVDSSVGGIAGDALPLFSSASVRRLNAGVGRHFRSRLSLSPMSEADSLDGGWIPATRTAWAAALATFVNATINNGSSNIGQSFMFPIVVSTQLGLALATPFTQASSWTQSITSMTLQRNAGSMVRRKPRLTVAIS